MILWKRILWLCIAGSLFIADGGSSCAASLEAAPSGGMKLLPEPVTAETLPKSVQVFDVRLGKVVNTLPNTQEIQTQAEAWISRFGALSEHISAEPKSGFVIRIPLSRPVPLAGQALGESAVELFVFIRAGSTESVEMLVFTQKGQPLLFKTKEELTPFIQKYGLQPILQTQ
jgi:hypothetical protein